MSNIRSKNTKPERVLFDLAKRFWRQGYRYRKHDKKLPGKPDLSFPTHKLAVFVDSEFWHGKDYGLWKKRLPKDYWRKKIAGNIKRDKEIDRKLHYKGWRIIRIWAKDLIKNPEKLQSRIARYLK